MEQLKINNKSNIKKNETNIQNTNKKNKKIHFIKNNELFNDLEINDLGNTNSKDDSCIDCNNIIRTTNSEHKYSLANNSCHKNSRLNSKLGNSSSKLNSKESLSRLNNRISFNDNNNNNTSNNIYYNKNTRFNTNMQHNINNYDYKFNTRSSREINSNNQYYNIVSSQNQNKIRYNSISNKSKHRFKSSSIYNQRNSNDNNSNNHNHCEISYKRSSNNPSNHLTTKTKRAKTLTSTKSFRTINSHLTQISYNSNFSNMPTQEEMTNFIIDNMRTQHAIILLFNYIQKEFFFSNNSSIKIKTFQILFYLYYLLQIVYFFSSFFQFPVWCHKYEYCDSEFSIITDIFISNTKFYLVQCILNVTFIIFNIFSLIVKHKSKQLNYKILLRVIFIVVFHTLSFVDHLLTIIYWRFGYFPYVGLITRGVLVVLMSQTLRNEWVTMLKVWLRSTKILLIMILLILIYTYIGILVFEDNPLIKNADGSIYVRTIGSLLEVFNLLTMSNFPDLMVNEFEYNYGISVAYFGSFLIINCFWFQELLQAIFYDNYNNIKKEETVKVLEKIAYLYNIIGSDRKNKENNDKNKQHNEDNSYFRNRAYCNESKIEKNEINTTDSKIKSKEIVNGDVIKEERKVFFDYNDIKEDYEEEAKDDNESFYVSLKKENIKVTGDSKDNDMKFHNSYHRDSINDIIDHMKNIEQEDDKNKDTSQNKSNNSLEIKDFNQDKEEQNNNDDINCDKEQSEKSDSSYSEQKILEYFQKVKRKIKLTKKEEDYILYTLLNPNKLALNAVLLSKDIEELEDKELLDTSEFILQDGFLSKDVESLNTNVIDYEEYLQNSNISNVYDFNITNMNMSNYNNNSNNSNNDESLLIMKLLSSTKYEIIINILNILPLSLFFLTDKDIIFSINLLPTTYFIIESFFKLSIKRRSFTYLLHKEKSFLIFLVINIFALILSITYFITKELFLITELIVFLRILRVLALLNKIEEFSFIFLAFDNMKKLYISLIFTLISFFYIFSSISMVFLSGLIKKGHFDNIDEIPNIYYHLNFNDFLGSMIACFSLVVNTNWTFINALTVSGGGWVTPFFSIFWFVAITLIMKIILTFILDMYINLKQSFSKYSEIEEEMIKQNKKIRNEHNINSNINSTSFISNSNLYDTNEIIDKDLNKCTGSNYNNNTNIGIPLLFNAESFYSGS